MTFDFVARFGAAQSLTAKSIWFTVLCRFEKMLKIGSERRSTGLPRLKSTKVVIVSGHGSPPTPLYSLRRYRRLPSQLGRGYPTQSLSNGRLCRRGIGVSDRHPLHQILATPLVILVGCCGRHVQPLGSCVRFLTKSQTQSVILTIIGETERLVAATLLSTVTQSVPVCTYHWLTKVIAWPVTTWSRAPQRLFC